MAVYEYATIRIERAAWPRLTDAVFGPVDAATRVARGSVYLLCAGLIGLASDEGILIRTWPDAATQMRESARTIAPAAAVVQWHAERLTPTVRPRDVAPPREPGVYAHRWFWLKPDQWDEFARLSQEGVWPYFESDGCRIVGLWRSEDEHPLCGALLITRYPTVAHWERTRLQAADPPPGADAELYRRAQEAGRRRAAITERSIVRLTRIALPPAGT
jgi:hypothetical protein